MQYWLAAHSGFCFGVKRSIRIASEEAEKTKGAVYTLGPLIHNPQVVRELEGKGITARETMEDCGEGVLVIRSHGVAPGAMQEAEDAGLQVVDATCPFVRKAQDLARSLQEEGYQVILVGGRDHPEVKSLVAHTGGKAVVVENREEVESLGKMTRVGVLSQTTQSLANLGKVVRFLVERTEELKVYNTICAATRERQQSAAEVARWADVMLVLGGYNSANTRRLREICQGVGTETHHIEEAEEIDPGWLEAKEKVGLAAGASTPDWIIRKVVDWLCGRGATSSRRSSKAT